MDEINGIINIFKNNCNYNKINEINEVKLRNKKDGIAITDAILYKFIYSDKNKTKQEVVSKINYLNDTKFTRQAYEGKENNISLQFYKLILNEIIIHYNKIVHSPDDPLFFAVDGTYNSDNKRNIMLNLGIFDITNNVPLDVTFCGSTNRNNEVKLFIQYIKNNLDKFKNVIFIADRLYFNYDLLDFLDSNDLKYITRVKGLGSNLNSANPIKKNIQKYEIINRLRKKVRIITNKKSYKKTIYSSKKKKKIKKHTIKVNSDCVLVTNLLDIDKYSDEAVLNHYKSRWDIEIFFKFIKNNFKFQYLNEKDNIQYEKMYLRELILTYIVKLIEHYYWKDKKPINVIIKKNGDKVECIQKINKSHLMKGIFESLFYNIINNDLSTEKLDKFCKKYIILTKNELNRSFPRNSKTPFTKWYIKGYSELTKYTKIINAIINKTTDKLHRNLRSIAKKIISIMDE
jgi:hypothetical protein